jgi:hypothetical protein
LRVTSRPLDAAAAPAYHASTTVCSSPNASTAITSPSTVSSVRSLWRSALRAISLNTNMSRARVVRPRAHRSARLFPDGRARARRGRLRVVGDHDDGLAESALSRCSIASTSVAEARSRSPVGSSATISTDR